MLRWEQAPNRQETQKTLLFFTALRKKRVFLREKEQPGDSLRIFRPFCLAYSATIKGRLSPKGSAFLSIYSYNIAVYQLFNGGVVRSNLMGNQIQIGTQSFNIFSVKTK